MIDAGCRKSIQLRIHRRMKRSDGFSTGHDCFTVRASTSTALRSGAQHSLVAAAIACKSDAVASDDSI